MRPRLLYLAAFLLFTAPTLLYYYLLWPLPGSQGLDSLRLAYHLHGLLPWLQIAGAGLALFATVRVFRTSPGWKTWTWMTILAAVAIGSLVLTHKVSAAAIFRPPETVAFARGTSDELPPETLVMGITAGDIAKAYPIRLLAYHHQLEDELDGEPITVTYCSMCRTGKVFRPVVGDQQLHFELIGAQYLNSVYRDLETGTWWYQANGRGMVGPLAGERLPELRADQMTLENWLQLHPDSLVFQPEPASSEGYQLFGFDRWDSLRSNADNPPIWRWVVGVEHGSTARAYPWALLTGERLILDEIDGSPIAVFLHSDQLSHRVWDRRLDGTVLELTLSPDHDDQLFDAASGTVFGFDGVAIEGPLAGQRLEVVSSTVEYWHSFERFSDGELYQEEPTTQIGRAHV